MTATGPRRGLSRRWIFFPLVAIALVVAAGVTRRVVGSHDAFAGLDAQEHDDLPGAHDANLERDTPASGLTPAEQFRRLDAELRNKPNDPALLASKIHLGLEFAPSVAVQECRRILQQSPDNYFALHHAAMAYLAMNNLDRAKYFAAQALQMRDTPEAHFVAGHVFYARGDFLNALKHYRAVLAKNPKDEAARACVDKVERLQAGRR